MFVITENIMKRSVQWKLWGEREACRQGSKC